MRRIILIFLLCITEQALSATFTINKIKVLGIQRISRDAVLQELTVGDGDKITDEQITKIMHNLYSTGFFKNIEINTDDKSNLIIKLVERPAIGKLELLGVKSKDKILKTLKDQGISESLMFDPVVLTKAEEELRQSYLAQGKYGIKISSEVNKMSKNRVHLKISIYEGDESKIRQIKIVGNKSFSSDVLKKQLFHAPTNWLSWFNKKDRYAKEKLAADLESLQSYYMDRGFIDFQVDSTQVSITPDKKHVYITINITEGMQYKFGSLGTDGKFVVAKQKVKEIIDNNIKPGEIFSRKKIWEVKQQIEGLLGEHGFSKADVRLNTDTMEKQRLVNIVFYLEPGNRIGVRRINISGNNMTQDKVIRRGFVQMESSQISTKDLTEGKEYIMREGFATDVQLETKDVPNKHDLVDVDIKVEESKTEQLSAGIAYSQADGFMFNLGADFKNFLGTGKDVNFTFDNSKVSSVYSFGYYNPYFTPDGIGMGYNLYYQKSNISKVSSAVFDYSSKTFGGDLNWTFPLTQYQQMSFGFGYDNTKLDFSQTTAPSEALNFINKEGTKYKEYSISGGWRFNNLDSYMFPTKGTYHKLAVRFSTPASTLKMYKAEYEANWFKPLYKDYILNLSSEIGYGSSYGSTNYPFFKHYYSGGAESIRGFEERSLGPKDSQSNVFGGNVLINAHAAVIFPTPFAKKAKTVRTSLFLDAGQVYDTNNKNRISGTSTISRNPAGLRYSCGVQLTWYSPLRIPMMFSLAKPLNYKSGDSKRMFAFTFGTKLF